jgi:hypothetical protein
VSISAPANGATVSGSVTISANASDNVGVVGVQFQVDGVNLGSQDTTSPYSISWSSTSVANGSHTLSAIASDAAGNKSTATVTVNVSNSTTTSNGLVAAYGFNEGSGTTVKDSSGNNNTGTISNATWATGRYGKALSFNGTNSWVTVQNSASLNLTGPMTLEAWIETSASPTDWQALIFKEMPSDTAYYLYRSGYSDAPVGGMYSSGEQSIVASNNLTLNTWMHLAFTYDGSTERLYVNGVLVASQAKTGAVQSSTGVLHIGGDSVWGEFFQGLIDEVRIYNRALSASEIQTDMNSPI